MSGMKAASAAASKQGTYSDFKKLMNDSEMIAALQKYTPGLHFNGTISAYTNEKRIGTKVEFTFDKTELERAWNGENMILFDRDENKHFTVWSNGRVDVKEEGTWAKLYLPWDRSCDLQMAIGRKGEGDIGIGKELWEDAVSRADDIGKDVYLKGGFSDDPRIKNAFECLPIKAVRISPDGQKVEYYIPYTIMEKHVDGVMVMAERKEWFDSSQFEAR